MRPHQHDTTDVPFSLVCSECDAGMNVDSHEQAVAEGWTDVDYAPDLPMANFVGLCPDCRECYGRWPTDENDN